MFKKGRFGRLLVLAPMIFSITSVGADEPKRKPVMDSRAVSFQIGDVAYGIGLIKNQQLDPFDRLNGVLEYYRGARILSDHDIGEASIPPVPAEIEEVWLALEKRLAAESPLAEQESKSLARIQRADTSKSTYRFIKSIPEDVSNRLFTVLRDYLARSESHALAPACLRLLSMRSQWRNVSLPNRLSLLDSLAKLVEQGKSISRASRLYGDLCTSLSEGSETHEARLVQILEARLKLLQAGTDEFFRALQPLSILALEHPLVLAHEKELEEWLCSGALARD